MLAKFCRKAYSSYMYTCIHADYLHVHHLKFVHCMLVVAFICPDSHTQSIVIQLIGNYLSVGQSVSPKYIEKQVG